MAMTMEREQDHHDQDEDQSRHLVWQNVPAALRQRPQWVVWRQVRRDGTLTKLLYNPRTDVPAKANDRTTWATFAEACACAEHSGYAGIGYVFSAEDPYTGVDLDGCRDATTGAVAAWAQTILARLDSYTEVSPSGTGVHILVHGALPPGRRRSGHIEMYDSGRYFTMTGAHLPGTPPVICERQVELTTFHAEVFGGSSAPQPAGQMAARRVAPGGSGTGRRPDRGTCCEGRPRRPS